MNYRIAKYAALACTIFWATGIARYAHQCIEHGAGASVPKITPLPPDSPFWNKSQDDDDDADCPTCAMLAMMFSPQIVEPPPLDLVGNCIEILKSVDQQAPVLHLVRTGYARGPPACSFPA